MIFSFRKLSGLQGVIKMLTFDTLSKRLWCIEYIKIYLCKVYRKSYILSTNMITLRGLHITQNEQIIILLTLISSCQMWKKTVEIASKHFGLIFKNYFKHSLSKVYYDNLPNKYNTLSLLSLFLYIDLCVCNGNRSLWCTLLNVYNGLSY